MKQQNYHFGFPKESFSEQFLKEPCFLTMKNTLIIQRTHLHYKEPFEHWKGFMDATGFSWIHQCPCLRWSMLQYYSRVRQWWASYSVNASHIRWVQCVPGGTVEAVLLWWLFFTVLLFSEKTLKKRSTGSFKPRVQLPEVKVSNTHTHTRARAHTQAHTHTD